LRYQGSKKELSKIIHPVILQHRKPGQTWVEPFCGGCNSIDKIEGPRIANDLHPNLIAMWRALQQGWEPPDEVTEQDWFRLKAEMWRGKVDPLLGFVGFGCAFGGVWFEGFAKDNSGTNYAAQSKRTVLKQIETMKDVQFYNVPYDEVPIPPNSLIYCDPPYDDTKGYRVGGFDHRRFWKWCNRMVAAGHDVFVSEYTAPPDWVPLWQKAVKMFKNNRAAAAETVSTSDASESVFIRAKAYDEQAARDYYNPPLHKLFSLKQVLHFVSGAARQDTSHLTIRDLRVTASNDYMTLSAPINVLHDVKPNAKTLAAAVKVADETKTPVAMKLMPSGRLQLQAGTFKASIECLDDHALEQALIPSGFYLAEPEAIYQAIEKVAPFMADDPLRPHAKGVHITSTTALATNNVVFGECWHGSKFDPKWNFAIGFDSIKQLLDIDELPVRIQLSTNTVTFWFAGERFFTTVLLEQTIPIERLHALFVDHPPLVDLPEDFFDHVNKLKKFAGEENILYVDANSMRTAHDADLGASVDIATGADRQVILTMHYVQQLEGIAARIAWSMWPNAMVWYGHKIRGLIVGRNR